MKLHHEQVGDLALKIECLENLNETIDRLFEELALTGDQSLLEDLCPYFGVIWPSARALSARLVELGAENLAGRRVLEVGCGLALPSLVAARLDAHVTATDFHPEVERFLTRNLELNGVPGLRYRRVDWRRDEIEPEAWDYVIGSDILYEQKHALEVAGIVSRMVAPRGTILLADPARPYLQAFADEMKRLGFQADTRIVTAHDDPGPKEIFLLAFTRP